MLTYVLYPAERVVWHSVAVQDGRNGTRIEHDLLIRITG